MSEVAKWGKFFTVPFPTTLYGALKSDSKDLDNAKAQLSSLMASRPDYVTPESQKKYFEFQKQRQGDEMPGYSQMKSRVKSGTAQQEANLINTSDSISNTLVGTSSIYGDEMNKLIDLDLASQNFKMNKADDYSKALQAKADYEDKAWSWNKAKKYEEQYNYLQSQIQGSALDKKLAQEKAIDSAMFVKDVVKTFFTKGALSGSGDKWKQQPTLRTTDYKNNWVMPTDKTTNETPMATSANINYNWNGTN